MREPDSVEMYKDHQDVLTFTETDKYLPRKHGEGGGRRGRIRKIGKDKTNNRTAHPRKKGLIIAGFYRK